MGGKKSLALPTQGTMPWAEQLQDLPPRLEPAHLPDLKGVLGYSTSWAWLLTGDHRRGSLEEHYQPVQLLLQHWGLHD